MEVAPAAPARPLWIIAKSDPASSGLRPTRPTRHFASA